MKFMKQFVIILAVTLAGEMLKHLLPLPVPDSIYGLVLLFALLAFHIIPVEAVKETGEFLIEIMPLMFIPAAVGLLEVWDTLRPILIPVCLITIISTIITMVVTGQVTQTIIRRKEKRHE